MVGIAFKTAKRNPPVWIAICHTCKKGCHGWGYCKGDALASLPCKSEKRLRKAGLAMPDWKELLKRDEGRYDLV